MKPPRISIVIPAHRDGTDFRRCLAACLDQDYADFEVVVVADRAFADLPEGARFLETGASGDTSPAEKRDAAFNVTSGDVLAFIDDDAYPANDWLKAAAAHFRDPAVGAVGGPGVTPPESSWRQRVGGAVYESPAGSAVLRYRFLPLPPRQVDDFPAYNLFIRREALGAVGGWGTSFYGGEDTVLCLKLAEAGWPVNYVPDVVVYHARRPILMPHLRQIANVGRHRGYFVRAFPATSRRALYMLPALVPAALVASAVLIQRRPALGLGLLASAYLLATGESMRRHPPDVAAATPAVTVAHHVAYGLAFLRGLAGGKMTR